MAVESVVLVCVAILFLGVLMRSHHLGYALATSIPIAITPVVYLFMNGVFYFTGFHFFDIRTEILRAFVSFLAVAISCAVVVAFSRQIKNNANRRLYSLVMLLYNIILGWVYVYNSIAPLLVKQA